MNQTSSLSHPWSHFTEAAAQVELILDSPEQKVDEDPIQDLSAAVCTGDTLFLGSDEGAWLERLSWSGENWAQHRRLDLCDYLDLDRLEEADVEGLAEDDGWLWVLGSHARTRPKIGKEENKTIEISKLGDLKDTRPRCLLARLPLVKDAEAPRLLLPSRKDGVRRAGMLKQTKRGNALAKALAQDSLVKPFTRIAAKEGGVDLEGIAVAGSRVAIGMRGPVIQTHAVLLEMELSSTRSGRLKLLHPPCKRLLDLDGLGIRDLKRFGDDLLILAGPTTDLDGPCTIYRWRGWLHEAAGADGTTCLHQPDRIIDLPFGRGDDHPEGLAIIRSERGSRLLVVCDSPSDQRIQAERRAITCDLFDLADFKGNGAGAA